MVVVSVAVDAPLLELSLGNVQLHLYPAVHELPWYISTTFPAQLVEDPYLDTVNVALTFEPIVVDDGFKLSAYVPEHEWPAPIT